MFRRSSHRQIVWILSMVLLLVLSLYVWRSQDGTVYATVGFTTSPARLDMTSHVPSHAPKPRPPECDVKCKTGTPCEYNEEVDLRIIVIVYNRAKSLRKCLESILKLDTLSDEVSLEIWIDRSKTGVIDSATHKVAQDFATLRWSGRACVHNQTANAYIGGQWIDTWRPKPGTRELAIILEDDINIAPMSYRWLKLVRDKYHKFPKLCGYTLQVENVLYGAPKKRYPIRGPKNDTVFFYNMMGTWGFSPAPDSWRNFQDWYHKTRAEGTLKPYVPNIVPTGWYKYFELRGTQEAMWEMWHIYYTYTNKEYCVFSNLRAFTGRSDVQLTTNRLEAGLHYGKGLASDKSKKLLRHWEDKYDELPDNPVFFQYDASSKRVKVV